MNIGWLYRTSFIITRRPCQSGLYIDGRECTHQPTKQCNVHALTSNIGIFLHVKRLANILPFYFFLLSSLPSLLCCPLHLSSSIPTLPFPPPFLPPSLPFFIFLRCLYCHYINSYVYTGWLYSTLLSLTKRPFESCSVSAPKRS